MVYPPGATVTVARWRTDRDRAMLLGGLRRGEVLRLRLEDLRLGEWRVFIAEGKGGHQQLVPISPTFFPTVTDYMNKERPPDAPTDRVFVSLKGPRRGHPLSAEGIIEIFSAARQRAGLLHGTCHELRHTCFTRLREAGMAIEAVQETGRTTPTTLIALCAPAIAKGPHGRESPRIYPTPIRDSPVN